MKKWLVRCALGVLVLGLSGAALAASSSNFRIDEDFIGPSGPGLNEGSANFKGGGADVGDLATGNSASTNFQTNSGFTTTADPGLTFVVNSGTVSLGTLSTSVASTATSTFSVKNYTSAGYVIQIVGNPPSNGSHTLTALAPKAASQVGTEQFGINLVANTSPVNPLGADPVQVPSSSFSSGAAAAGDVTNTGYAKANFFRYASGETIAQASKDSGETDYTISYIANAATTTPGGSYSGALVLVCTGTY